MKKTHFCVLFEGRTGSSMLGGILNQNRGISFLGEEAGTLCSNGWCAQRRWIETLFERPQELNDRRFQHESRAIGFKIKLRETADRRSFRACLEHFQVKIIHMTRKNLVKQVVSSIRAMALYKRTGLYNLRADEHEHLMPSRSAIAVQEFDRVLRWIGSSNSQLECFVASLQQPVLGVSYEELIGDTKGCVARVCDYLVVPKHDFRVPTLKVSNDDLRDCIENYDELRAAYASSTIAAMFE